MISRLLAAAAACVCALGLGSARTEAQTLTHRIDTVSAWGGAVNAFVRVGNIGYCGSGQRLVVLDVSNPSNQASFPELGSVNVEATIQDIVVRGNYAYVLTAQAPFPFLVVDVSAASSPRIVWWETAQLPSNATGLRLYGDVAYLLTPSSIGRAYDLTDPLHPALYPSNVQFGVGPDFTLPDDFQISGHYAYVIGDSLSLGVNSLAIFDLEPNPLQPWTLVGRVTVPNTYRGTHLAIAGNRVVFTANTYDPSFPPGGDDAHNIVWIADVSNPAQPVLQGSYNNVWNATGVAIQGNLAFIADWFEATDKSPPDPSCNLPLGLIKGLAVLDISSPGAPALVGTYNTGHSSIRGVRVDGSQAYVLCDGQGLEVLNVANPAQPARVGGYYSPSAFRVLTKHGNHLYAVDEFNGFTILDVSNPSAPAVRGVYRSPGGVTFQGHWSVQVRDDLAYLAAGHSGIQVVDVANPAAPVLRWQFMEPGADFDVHAIELDGNLLHVSYAYVPTCGSDGSGLYANYTLPAAPPAGPPYFTYTGSVVLFRWFERLITVQGISFCTGKRLGTYSYRIDTRAPASPVYLGEDPWGGTDLELAGSTLYGVSLGLDRLDAVNVADPLQATLAWSVQLPQTQSVGASAGRIVVATQYLNCPQICVGMGSQMIALDASSATQPAASAFSHVFPTDMLADGDVLYTASGGYEFTSDPRSRAGIVIQRYRCATDMDDNGALNVNDFVGFINTFAGRSLRADIDRNRALNVNDFVAFINAYAAGCD